MSRIEDYESIDRYMSGWFISCVKDGTRFYMTAPGTATDMLTRAAWFRWGDDAERTAAMMREDWAALPYGSGFDWQPIAAAEVSS